MSGEAVMDENTKKLFENARRHLLANQPLSADSWAGGSGEQALSAGEVEALKSVGLETRAWEQGAERDPLRQSIRDFVALLEASYTASEAARYLRVDASRIRQRLRERSLFGVDYEGEKRLLRFQFERRRVVRGLREVLAALPKELNPLDVAEWFLSPNPDLELGGEESPLSPREWLLGGRPIEAMVAVARGFAAGVD
jgi:hypothetical protein